MRKVGFITSPLTSGHAVRGVGYYTKYLLESMKSLAPTFGFEIIEISDNLQLTTHNPQLIHYPFFDLFRHSLPIFSRVPTVVTIHDVIPLEFPDIYQPGLRAQVSLSLQKIALSRVNRIITDSQASKQRITKLLGVPESRIIPIHLAARDGLVPVTDKNTLSFIRQKYHLPDKFILFVGDLNWNKNLVTLATVANQLKFPLILVGKQILEIKNMDLHHPEHAHLSELIKQFQNPNIMSLGFVPDNELSAIYSLTTIYCQPSYAEGFGLPVLEAFACGTPVVCSQTHSLPEIAENAALFFDPFNVDDLSDKLKLVWDDSELQKSLSKLGLIQVTKFSWANTARETLKVYTDVLR